MPSLPHEILVELFRSAPDLGPRLARSLGAAIPEGRVEVASADLGELIPASYRADLVVRILDDERRVAASLIVEVQLRRDEDKPAVWCAYLGAEVARTRAPAHLMIVVVDEGTAAWARGPLLGEGWGMTVHPLVVGPSQVPRITDGKEARGSPELAVLSTLAHGRGADGARIAANAVASLALVAEGSRKLYLEVILSAVSKAIRRELEALMALDYADDNDLTRQWAAWARQETREEDERREHARWLQASRKLLRAKLGREEPALEARLAGLSSEVLSTLVVDLGMATDAEAARAIVERA